MDLREIGGRLKKIREKTGMKQKEAAIKIGISNDMLCRYEKGQSMAPYGVLDKLASLYKVSTDHLLGRNNNGFKSLNIYPLGPTVKIPVLGVIRAGEPIYTDQNIIGYEDVSADEVKDGEYFFLEVTGDSMTGSRIYPGDKVLVRRQEYVEGNQIAVILVGEEATLKRVKYINETVILYPDNPKCQPQAYKVEEVKILGVVKKVEFKP